MAGEYAFVIKDLRKVVPPKREILRGIWLSFFHGAKIGVLGANGAGKSSLLRIMAGVDTDFLGEAFPAAGLRIGYLPQEPQLDPAKDVRGNVEEGVAETRALLTRFEAVSARLGEPLEADGLEQKQERLAREEKADAARQRTLARELEWVRMAPRARQAKGKARLKNYEAMLAESGDQRAQTLEITIPAGPRLGDVVVEADGVSKAYGDRVLIEKLAFKLPRGGIVGVIGPNGAGKTTLFRLLVGQEKPDAGTLRLGETVTLAYVDQSRDALDGKKTVWEEISEGADTLSVGGRTLQSRAYVASFNFKGSDQQTRVGELSGGERNRLHLAKILKRGANLILLDEPTNDLDVDTLRALEDALVDFAGCALVITHDRWFLDRIATHILAFEDEGRVGWFEGNYADYEADRRKRLGAEAERPHRLKYKRLPRA